MIDVTMPLEVVIYGKVLPARIVDMNRKTFDQYTTVLMVLEHKREFAVYADIRSGDAYAVAGQDPAVVRNTYYDV